MPNAETNHKAARRMPKIPDKPGGRAHGVLKFWKLATKQKPYRCDARKNMVDAREVDTLQFKSGQRVAGGGDYYENLD